MKKIITLALLIFACSAAFAWGPRGHSTVASLADELIRPSTRKQVEGYLGHSMAFYSTWMDERRDEEAYKFSSPCHSFPVDENNRYAPVDGQLDAISLLEQAISVVKDRKNQTDSAVVVNLKFIIHLVGDIHCPGHVKYSYIKTNFKVTEYKGENNVISYHHVWDQSIIDRRCKCLSPVELAHDLNRLSKKEMKEVQKGTPLEWGESNAEKSVVIYDMAKPGDVLFKPFYNPAWEIVYEHITLAGYRLAKVLDDCFSN